MFSRLIVKKNPVYMIHDFSGIARGARKNDLEPALNDRKFGSVRRAARANWTNVIRAPGELVMGVNEARGCSYLHVVDLCAIEDNSQPGMHAYYHNLTHKLLLT